MIVPFTALLISCNEGDPTVIYQLTLSENSVVFDMGGATKEIDVIPFPNNELWEASCDEPQDWFSFVAESDALSITVLPNYSLESRHAVIVLSSPEGRFRPYEVAVVQEAAYELEFSTSASDYDFDSEGGEYRFTIRSNYDWTVSSSASWLEVDADATKGLVTLSAQPNMSDESLSALVSISVAGGEQEKVVDFAFTQGTRAENPYFKLLGQWEITAAKWYYSPNGSLNNLDYNPNQTDYYLIFNMEQGEYGKTLIMKDFLYPGTELEVRYDKETGNIVIPFGWTVYSYDVFLYITLVSDTKFSYASLEVDGVPSEDYTSISLELPTVDGWKYIGFGLWTYNDSGNKVALGSRSRPTMFPMGPISFIKQSL